MTNLDPGKLHVRFGEKTTPQGPLKPRVYTLTHSDLTGELFLTVGREVDNDQISGWYTRFMRDEVLASWEMDERPELHVHCHVSGGFVLGSASWRESIFRQHLPMVLAAFRYGDRKLIEHYPEMDESQVVVHFHTARRGAGRTEGFGKLGDYIHEGVQDS